MFKNLKKVFLKEKTYKTLTILGLFLSITVGFISNVKAQNTTAFGLIIDEIRMDLSTVKPGSSISKSFNITHDYSDENKKTVLYPKALDYTSDNVSGTPKFLAPGTLSNKGSLASWISVDRSSIELTKKGQKEKVTFTINVPQDAEPGGKYAAILLTENPDVEQIMKDNPNSQNLAISKQIGPILLLNIDGDIKKDLSLESAKLQDINGKNKSFFFNPPVSIVSNFKNSGNVHLIPKGEIYIYKGVDHNKHVAKLDLNGTKSYTLPNSTRILSTTWEDSFIKTVKEKDANGKEYTKTIYDWDKLSRLRIGKYNVKIIYSYEGETATKEINLSFWVIPLPIIIAAGILLLLIALFVGRKIYKKKNKKKTDDFKL